MYIRPVLRIRLNIFLSENFFFFKQQKVKNLFKEESLNNNRVLRKAAEEKEKFTHTFVHIYDNC